MILVLLYANQNIRNLIDTSGGRGSIEKCIVKALPDANTAVREEMRKAFWAYYELWPIHGQRVLDTLDTSVRRALERVNPGGNTSISVANVSSKSSTFFRDHSMGSRDRPHSSSRLTKRDSSREPREKRETSAPLPSQSIPNPPNNSGVSGSQHLGFKANLGLPQRNPNRSVTAL